MHEIKCPHCGQTFKVDESGYADILKQVRDTEFESALHDRLKLAEDSKKTEIELAEAKIARKFEEEASKAAAKRAEEAAKKDAEIAELKAVAAAAETTKKLALAEAVASIEKERDALKGNLKLAEMQKELEAKALEEKYADEIKMRNDEIARLTDFKAKLSTKMVGETLEIHCETEFNRLRATAFPRAYFEKDNDARSGSKGDYIFRDSDEAGTEFVSVMFEMKNESDTTATKKKNEDFLKELDKDRNEKGCEFAVLVSLLEPESDLYNTGIVDVSHRYPKMYVIRPQFFIPMITLLRNAAQNSLQYKTELALVRDQNIDVSNFEDDLESFKAGFAKNYDLASRKFADAIDEIDKAIDRLNKVKTALQGSENNLRLANNKAQDVTVKKLTASNLTMATMFEQARKTNEGKK